MKTILPAMIVALVLPFAASAQQSPQTDTPSYITQAIHDPAREADRADDARRQMAAVMTFARVKPGDEVLELIPASGYWTRVFSGIVGPKGHVYTVWPNEFAKYSRESYANWQKLVDTPHYANVSLSKQPIAKLDVPAPVDLVFTSQNYHDYHNKMDIAEFNKKMFAALKPGGLFVIIDHVAPAGSGASDTDTLHRIDPALVKHEVEAAGFVFDG
ncbi:MAG TPA: methyltransferase, partial [Gammaproteobacteria bacterium]|nr:methyltransferase [Gammaproteobacteria bacterium]